MGEGEGADGIKRGERKEVFTHFIIFVTQQQTSILGETTGDSSLLLHPAVPLTSPWYFPMLFQPWTILRT